MLNFRKNKIFLFFDSISRISFKQSYYLFSHKILKRIVQVLYQPSYSNLEWDEVISWEEFSHNNSFWKTLDCFEVNKYYKFYHEYHKKLIEIDLNNIVIKDIWKETNDFEINNNYQRFQLFHLLYSKNRSEKVTNLIAEWINLHKEVKGLGWASFNCSMRLFNWLKILHYNGEQLNKEDWYSIQNSIFKQAQHIIKNIEHHIPGNHVILQYFSLLVVFEVFPNWSFTKQNKNSIQKKFEDEIIFEFFNNGLHFEQSYHYHIQITLMCLFLLIINKDSVSKSTAVNERIESSIKTVFRFRLAGWYLPMLGDNCFNFFNPTLYDDFDHIEYLNHKLYPNIDNNPKGLFKYEDQYAIYKNDINEIIFDIGNIGLRCNPGHGHADISSFLYSSNGIPILIDGGTKMYSNSTEDLELKKTKMHNTLNINNEDQARLWGFFRWAYLPKKIISDISDSKEELRLFNKFEGLYTEGKYIHKREIIIIKNADYLKIFDEVEANGKNKIYLNLILHPDLTCELIENKFLIKYNGMKWEISTSTKSQKNIKKINIYPNYDVPFNSFGLEIKFNSVNFPFKNTTIIKRV